MAIENLLKHLILAVLILVFSFWLYIYIDIASPKKTATPSTAQVKVGKKFIICVKEDRPQSSRAGCPKLRTPPTLTLIVG